MDQGTALPRPGRASHIAARRRRAADRSRARRTVPSVIAALLHERTVDGGYLLADPGRLGAPIPITTTAVWSAARRLGHHPTRRQADAITAELTRISLAVAHRRAGRDEDDHSVVAWAASRDAEDRWTEAARRGGRGAAA